MFASTKLFLPYEKLFNRAVQILLKFAHKKKFPKELGILSQTNLLTKKSERIKLL